MANPFVTMIAWLFRQGMAAVKFDERFKALDDRISAVRTELVSQDEKTKLEMFLHMQRLQAATQQDISKLGTELRGEMSAQNTELCGKISALGTELRGEMSSLGTALRSEISAVGREVSSLSGRFDEAMRIYDRLIPSEPERKSARPR
jgi:hypothetical protein